MKYKNTLADAKKYNRTKDIQNKTVDCSDCGAKIKLNGENCVSFGVYSCQLCRTKEKGVVTPSTPDPLDNRKKKDVKAGFLPV